MYWSLDTSRNSSGFQHGVFGLMLEKLQHILNQMVKDKQSGWLKVRLYFRLSNMKIKIQTEYKDPLGRKTWW